MTERGELISLLESLSEEKFRVFNEKIVHTSKYRVIGVRMSCDVLTKKFILSS